MSGFTVREKEQIMRNVGFDFEGSVNKAWRSFKKTDLFDVRDCPFCGDKTILYPVDGYASYNCGKGCDVSTEWLRKDNNLAWNFSLIAIGFLIISVILFFA